MVVRLTRSVALMVLAAAFCAAAPATSTAPAVSRPAAGIVEDPTVPMAVHANANGGVSTGFINRHNQFVATAKKGGIDLYMEGDSITDFWGGRFKANWDKNLGGWKPGCFGISGDRTQNVLYRIENGEFEGVTPKVVVLLIGTNNLASNATYGENTVEDTVKGVKACVAAIQKHAPQAKVLVMGIFPRNDPPPKARPDINVRIGQVNEALAKMDNGTTVKFLNINDKLADKDGKLIPGVMNSDNLHPSDKGYQIWADAMKPILTEWLGAPATASASAPAP